MMEFLTFMFSGFWTWLGCAILLYLPLQALVLIAGSFRPITFNKDMRSYSKWTTGKNEKPEGEAGR